MKTNQHPKTCPWCACHAVVQVFANTGALSHYGCGVCGRPFLTLNCYGVRGLLEDSPTPRLSTLHRIFVRGLHARRRKGEPK